MFIGCWCFARWLLMWRACEAFQQLDTFCTDTARKSWTRRSTKLARWSFRSWCSSKTGFYFRISSRFVRSRSAWTAADVSRYAEISNLAKVVAKAVSSVCNKHSIFCLLPLTKQLVKELCDAGPNFCDKKIQVCSVFSAKENSDRR